MADTHHHQPSHRQILQEIKVESICSKNIFSVSADDSAQIAFEKLLAKNILSAPIFDEHQKKYVGMIDIVDIVTFIVSLFSHGETFSTVFLGEKAFVSTPIKEISDLSHRNPYKEISADTSLLSAMEQLQTVHRACVIDENGNVIGILTQSALIAYLSHHLPAVLGNHRHKTIAQLGLGIKHVHTIGFRDKAINAFRKMTEVGVSALAVVDERGELLSNISGKDLKVITGQFDQHILRKEGYNLAYLFKPVNELLTDIRREEINVRIPYLSVYDDNTIEDLVVKLVGTRVHRIYVKAKNNALIGVISIGDIIKKILELTASGH